MGNLAISPTATHKPTALLAPQPRLFFFFKHVEFGQTIRQLLEADFTISIKSDDEALKQIKLEDCDLVITDNTQGILKPIRTNPAFNNLPVIVMLCPADSPLQVMALDSGANEVIVMPITA